MKRLVEWARSLRVRFKLFLLRKGLREVVDLTDPTKPNRTGVCLVRAGIVFGEKPNSTPIAPIPVPERLRDKPWSIDVEVLGPDRRIHFVQD